MRLKRVLDLVALTGNAVRIIVFGSFVTEKAVPNDVDPFLVMDDAFDLNALAGEARIVFEHGSAQAHFGASVFWVRRSACFPSEAEMISGWGLKRDGSVRGIVEITEEIT
jgi:predicted nucleotidyltransferase